MIILQKPYFIRCVKWWVFLFSSVKSRVILFKNQKNQSVFVKRNSKQDFRIYTYSFLNPLQSLFFLVHKVFHSLKYEQSFNLSPVPFYTKKDLFIFISLKEKATEKVNDFPSTVHIQNARLIPTNRNCVFRQPSHKDSQNLSTGVLRSKYQNLSICFLPLCWIADRGWT